MNRSFLAAPISLLMFFHSAAEATPYYVDNCGSDTLCNGQSSACAGSGTCAKKTIQAGINATTTDGDVVVVADGTYAGTGNKNLTFNNNRRISVLCANEESGCTIDCDDSGRAFYFNGEQKVVTINGFTILDGYVTTSSAGGAVGGGIAILNSAPKIVDNIIQSC